MIEGRLIIDTAAAGPWNMALDQALLEEVDNGGPATLRFYAWSVPTLSLGYFQSLADRNQHAAIRTTPLVRRATGGGAILHDDELTYSLCLPIADRARRQSRAVYDALHRAIIAALFDLGVAVTRFADSAAATPKPPEPFLCFQRRSDEDLVLAAYKVAGSAQRRAARAVLQHGSLLLSASRYAPQLPGIFELTSKRLAYDVVAPRIAHHAAAELGIRWTEAPTPTAVLQRAKQVEDERFAHKSWTTRH